MTQPARPSGTDSLKILVVDDEPAMVGALGALLGQAGHREVQKDEVRRVLTEAT